MNSDQMSHGRGNDTEDLLNRARQGDREAMASLLGECGAEVRQSLVGRIPRRWRSVLSEDDVMQQSYMDAILSISRFEPRGEGSFRAWLTSLAQQNLIDALRMLGTQKRGGGRRRVGLAPSDEHHLSLCDLAEATTRPPSRHAGRPEAGGPLMRALQQLPPNYRRVVEMFDMAELPVAVIAAEMGRSVGAVYMLRTRALERLAEIMGPASGYLSRA